MATATEIIECLGGPAEIARETGFPLTTIASWGEVNSIPEWRRPQLFALASRKRVVLPNFPTPDQRTPRGTLAA